MADDDTKPDAKPGDGDGKPDAKPGDGDGKGDDKGAVSRAEFDGLAGKVDRVLGLLEGGKGPGKDDGAPAGPSVADQVRAGIDELEAKRKADEAAQAEKSQREDHERRLAALEEKPPGPADTWLARAQRRLYGTEPDGSAVARKARQGAAQ